ncbi:MAG: HDOD domain-containing protein [Thermodesulfobacteriota bacterium]
MPSLSTTVTRVLEICNNPTTSPNDLNRVISLDPVLTGQVLKLINSAYYSLPNQVTSLTRAIIMLGLNTVKNLALSTAVLHSLGGARSFQALTMDEFWTHSIGVGVLAKAMAAALGVPAAEREEYFVAGLLHDLGKIPMNNRFAAEYGQAVQLARLEQGALLRAELTILGLEHCQVGGLIADKWQLSVPLRGSLRHHHDPAQADQAARPLVAVVGLANLYINAFEIGSAADPHPDPYLLTDLLGQVGVTWSQLTDLHPTVLAQIDNAKIFLRIAQRG